MGKTCLALAAGLGFVSIAGAGSYEAADLTPLKEPVRILSSEKVLWTDGGRAAMPIVWPVLKDHRHVKYLTIAKKLADVIREMTGAEVKIVREYSDRPYTNSPAIHIGPTSVAVRYGLAPKADEGVPFGTEAGRFRVKIGRDYCFFGGNRGDYAVADFLERILDVRQFWPTKDGGLCVARRSRLEVPQVEYTDAPVFARRDLYPYTGSEWAQMWKVGNEHSGVHHVHAPHTWNRDTNTNYRVTCPEIFARMDDGQRGYTPLLCYGNPRTLEVYKQRIADEIERGIPSGGLVDKRAKCITVSQWDVAVYCSCEHCKRLCRPEMGNTGDFSPVLWGYFTKELAEWLHEKYPDWFISILPYKNTCDVPPGLTYPHKNVEAMLCTMPGLALLKTDWVREYEENLIDAWYRATGRPVQNWHYICWPAEFTIAPYVFGETIVRHYRTMRDRCVGSFLNGGYPLDRLALSAYVWERCLWNPDIDLYAVYDSFCNRLFGAAARPMRRLVALQEKGWNAQWKGSRCSNRNIYGDSYPKPVVDEMKALIAEAKRLAAGDGLALRRVEYYTKCFAPFFKEADEYANNSAFAPLMVVKASRRPKVDGVLDEGDWVNADPVSFVNAMNRTNATPKCQTQVKALWTPDGVTFGFMCREPAVDKLALKAPPGTYWGNDCLEVFIDATGEGAGDFVQVVVNANGTLDYYSQGITWHPKGVENAVHVDLAGKFWSAELYVPYAALSEVRGLRKTTTSAGGCVWTGNFVRLRIGDSRLPEAERQPGSEREMTRAWTRYSGWNKDPNAFAQFKFVEN